MKFIRNKNKNCVIPAEAGIQATAGFTLIETLVAISIFVASVTVLLVVTGGGIKDVNSAQNKLTATYLAQEGAELVRAARDTYFMEETARQNAIHGVNSPLITPPTMNRLTQFCNTKTGLDDDDDDDGTPPVGTPPYNFCHALDVYTSNTPWVYNPDWITSHPNATADQIAHIAGPLGACNRVVGNGISDAALAGSRQGCNINLALDTRVCRIVMQLKKYEKYNDLDGPTLEEGKTGISTETCAEYFYNEGVFRPKWTMAFNADGDPIYPSGTVGTFSGFSRQIFVDPEFVGGDSDGGMRVTVRVYWIEGNRLRHVRVDDFLTGWPSTTVVTP